MTSTIDTIHQELSELKRDMEFIKNIIREDYEFNEETNNALDVARNTPESEYVDL